MKRKEERRREPWGGEGGRKQGLGGEKIWTVHKQGKTGKKKT